MHEAGELPVNVRVLIEGEEESSSGQVLDWIASDARGADAAIVFDSGMAAEDLPAITTACRGYVAATVTVRVSPAGIWSVTGRVTGAWPEAAAMSEACTA